MYYYKAYGLSIRSVFHLPELAPAEGGGDIEIRKTRLFPPKLERTTIWRQNIEASFGGGPNVAYLRWPGVVTVRASNGTTLDVDPATDDLDPQLLSLFTLSEAFGLLLHQRGYFLLHGSAVRIDDEAVVLLGRPGSGKSTTAAAFAKLGHVVLSDDMVAIDFSSDASPVVVPAFSQIKIWPKTVKGLGYDPASLRPLFQGSRKRVFRDQEKFLSDPVPLTNAFVLYDTPNTDGPPRLKISRIPPNKRHLNLTRFFPCPSALLDGPALFEHFAKCQKLLKQVDLWKLHKQRGFQALERWAAWIARGVTSGQLTEGYGPPNT